MNFTVTHLSAILWLNVAYLCARHVLAHNLKRVDVSIDPFILAAFVHLCCELWFRHTFIFFNSAAAAAQSSSSECSSM